MLLTVTLHPGCSQYDIPDESGLGSNESVESTPRFSSIAFANTAIMSSWSLFSFSSFSTGLCIMPPASGGIGGIGDVSNCKVSRTCSD